MALPRTLQAQGATLTAATSSFAAQVLGIGVEGRERPARKVTNYSTTGFHQYRAGILEEPGTITLQIQLNDADQPPLNAVAEVWTITFPLNSGDISAATYSGTGFVTSFSFDGTGGDEDEVTGEITIQFDGDTGPTFTAAT